MGQMWRPFSDRRAGQEVSPAPTLSRRAALLGAAAALAAPVLGARGARAQTPEQLTALTTALETLQIAPGAGDFLGYSGPPFIGPDGPAAIAAAMLADYDPAASPLRWPARDQDPDRRHFAADAGAAPFIVTPEALARAAERNGFALGGDRVLFALRGARPLLGATPTLRLATPDFTSFQCVLGVWRRGAADTITLFRASTVPCAPLVHLQRRARNAAKWAHLTPTGLHRVRAGAWRADRPRPQAGTLLFTEPYAALRPFGRGDGSPAFSVAERWELTPAAYGDGVVAGQLEGAPYQGAAFALAGGIALRGGHDGTSARGDLAAFLDAALNGLADRAASLPFMLLGGQDLREAAFETGEQPALRRLRFGSSGPAVTALQTALGTPATGVFDGATQAAVIKDQLQGARRADGIVTAEAARNEHQIIL